MADWFSTRVLQGGGHSKNFTLEITGSLADEYPPTAAHKFEGDRLVKLSSAVWCIEEKAGLRLYWGECKRLIVPMESRSAVRYDVDLPSPPDWDRTIWLAVRKVTEIHMFSIILDFNQ